MEPSIIHYRCAVLQCDWSRTSPREDLPAGLEVFEEFDVHEAEAHPYGAHMQITTEWRE